MVNSYIFYMIKKCYIFAKNKLCENRLFSNKILL